MSVLFSLIDAGLAFGAHPLLDGAAFTLTAGERLGLIGRNGTGKSSLLNVIAGRIQLDDGRAVVRDGLRIVLVEQEPVLPPAGTLFESLLARGTAAGLVDERDERRYWALQARLRAELDRFGVDPEADPEGLSGGQNKRAALALAFALEPDLLLLDEPTNHLDIEAIEALEAIVNAGPAAIIITHDRRFLDQVATRIIELDRGLVRSFPGNFATYEKVRGEQLEAEAVANRKFDKFWAQEEVWIRKGIEARRTRNEGRVRRLEALREARAARRERTGQIRLEVDAGERSGKLVCETRQAGISLGGRCLVRDLDLTIMRGDRIGLIGPNGIGKSTLVKLILGEYPPGQPAGAGRAHQRPGPGIHRPAGKHAAVLPGHTAAGQPRPALPRQRGYVGAGGPGRWPLAGTGGRLFRLAGLASDPAEPGAVGLRCGGHRVVIRAGRRGGQ